MRAPFVWFAGLISALIAGVAFWRRHPRMGAGFVNRVVDPWLVRIGVIDRTHGEIGLLEHVGRRTGTTRLSPIRPVATDRGFRIVVPLGTRSHWAQNVLAAGHCRIQVGRTIHELDEPALVAPSAVSGIAAPIAAVAGWLGFRYLLLHRLSEHPGGLADPDRPAVEEALEKPLPAPDPVTAAALA